MNDSTPNQWDMRNLAHRYTISFFKSNYSDEPSDTTQEGRENKEMNYFNVTSSNNTIRGSICAGLMVEYMRNQGIPFEEGKSADECFPALSSQLSKPEGKVIDFANLVDDYYKFFNE